jgi:hypothetical protein
MSGKGSSGRADFKVEIFGRRLLKGKKEVGSFRTSGRIQIPITK